MSKKSTLTLEERIIRNVKSNFDRLCGDLITEQAGGMGDPSGPQNDPAQAAAGTFPPPGSRPEPDQVPTGPKTAETPQAGDGMGQSVDEIKEEIYELMKEFGDASEGFLEKYFEEKGYKAADVKAALKSLQDEGRADKRSTWFLGVEEGDQMGKEGEEAGVTPGATEGDVPGGAGGMGPGAGAGGAPNAGAEGTATPAMRNAMKNSSRNNYNPREDDGDFDTDDEQRMDDEDLDADDDEGFDDDEIEIGNEDEIPGGEGGHEEMEMDAVGEIKDDIRDAQALLKSIMTRLDDIEGGHQEGEEGPEDMDFMRNMKRNRAKNYKRNYSYNAGDFGGDRYGASSAHTDPTGRRFGGREMRGGFPR